MAEIRIGVSRPLPAARQIKDYSVGETAELTRRFGAEEVSAFAELVGDNNPIHFDEAYAATTLFGRCIVHGTLYSGLLGTVLGTRCPGPGTILVTQKHRFLRPLYVNDIVTATVSITKIEQEKGVIHLDLACRNEAGIQVLSGWATTRVAR